MPRILDEDEEVKEALEDFNANEDNTSEYGGDEDSEKEIRRKFCPENLRERLIAVNVPGLRQPPSTFENYVAPMERTYERDMLKRLFAEDKELIAQGKEGLLKEAEDGFIYLELEDFAFYCTDKTPRMNNEFCCLHELCIVRGKPELLFDGIVRTPSGDRYYLERIRFTTHSIGAFLEPARHTVGQDLWIQSDVAKGFNVWYTLNRSKPHKHYREYWEPYLWLADFARHFIDYLDAAKMKNGLDLRCFREDFSEWLEDVHGENSPTEDLAEEDDREADEKGRMEFRLWRNQYPHKDFRQAVVQYKHFLHQQTTNTKSSLYTRHQQLWSEVFCENITEIPETMIRDTVTTPLVHEIFGPIFKEVLMRVEPKHPPNNYPISTDVTPRALDPHPDPDREIITLEDIKKGDIVAIHPDEETDWKVGDSPFWYGYVREIVGENIFVTWLYLPEDTLLKGSHYPYKNEIFFSDHCNCNDTPLTAADVVKIFTCDLFVGPGETKKDFFIRTTLMKESGSFVTLKQSDVDLCTCCAVDKFDSAYVKAKRQYQVGDTVLLITSHKDKEDTLEPAIIEMFNDETEKIKFRPLYRRRDDMKYEVLKSDELGAVNELTLTDDSACIMTMISRNAPGASTLSTIATAAKTKTASTTHAKTATTTKATGSATKEGSATKGSATTKDGSRISDEVVKANELCYTELDPVELRADDIVRRCRVRFFKPGEKLTTPYDRDGCGDCFFIRYKVKEIADDTFELSPYPFNLAVPVRESYSPEEQTPRKPLKGMDLFCGGGNFGRGIEEGGAVINKWACDLYKHALCTYAANNEHDCSFYYGSVNNMLKTAMDGKYGQMIPHPDEVDFISAGSPCQGFSNANPNKYSEGSQRNASMVASVASFVDFYRPRYALLENVHGMASMRKITHADGSKGTYNVFAVMLAAIVAMGYQVQHFTMDAWSHGSHQLRTRLFISIAAAGERLPPVPARSHSHHPNAKSRAIFEAPNGKKYASREMGGPTPFKFVSAMEGFGDLPFLGDGHPHVCIPYPDHVHSRREGTASRIMVTLIPVNELTKPLRDPVYGGALSVRSLKGARIAGIICEVTERKASKKKTRKGNKAWARISPYEPCRTITTSIVPACDFTGEWVHYAQMRILTIMEARRAQSFPDHEVLLGGTADQFKIVGNSVDRRVALALGISIREAWFGSTLATEFVGVIEDARVPKAVRTGVAKATDFPKVANGSTVLVVNTKGKQPFRPPLPPVGERGPRGRLSINPSATTSSSDKENDDGNRTSAKKSGRVRELKEPAEDMDVDMEDDDDGLPSPVPIPQTPSRKRTHDSDLSSDELNIPSSIRKSAATTPQSAPGPSTKRRRVIRKDEQSPATRTVTSASASNRRTTIAGGERLPSGRRVRKSTIKPTDTAPKTDEEEDTIVFNTGWEPLASSKENPIELD